MNKEFVELALSFYVNEPCRICGELLTRKDLDGAVWVGYSENNDARTAHLECWRKYPAKNNKPRKEWFYQ